MLRTFSFLMLGLALAACGARSTLVGDDASSGAATASASSSSAMASSVASSSSSGAGGDALCHPGDAPVEIGSVALAGPRHLAIDATDAYLTDMGQFSGRVLRVPLAGGAPVELATQLERPGAIAVDDTYVYWTDALAGHVFRLPKGGGGTPEPLGPWQHGPEAVVLRPEGIYWLNRGNPNDGAVVLLPTGATDPKVLYGGLHDAAQLAVDESAVFWTTDAQGSLNKAPIGGGGPIEYFAPIDTPRALALDDTHVYIAKAGEIDRSDKVTGPLQTLASPAVARGMAVRGDFLYWASSFKGVNKVPVQGGAPVHLGDDMNAADVAVDDACVYWIGSGVWRAPR